MTDIVKARPTLTSFFMEKEKKRLHAYAAEEGIDVLAFINNREDDMIAIKEAVQELVVTPSAPAWLSGCPGFLTECSFLGQSRRLLLQWSRG